MKARIKKTILAFLFVLPLSILFSQSNFKKDSVLLKQLADSIEKYNQFDLAKSYKFFSAAFKQVDLSNHPFRTAMLYQIMADAYWYNGNTQLALTYYLKEQRIADSLKNNLLDAQAKYNIGWIKAIQFKQRDQIHYLYEALKIFEKEKKIQDMFKTYDAIGSFYGHFKHTSFFNKDSTIKYYNKCLELSNVDIKPRNIIGIKVNLGEFYNEYGDYKTAHNYLIKALNLAKKSSFSFYIPVIKSLLVETYFNLDSIDKAKQLIKEVEPEIRKNSDRLYYKIVLEAKHKIYYLENDYKNAYLTFAKLKVLIDTIAEYDENQSLLQQETNYLITKKDKEVKQAEYQNKLEEEKNKTNKRIIWSLIIVVLSIIFLLFMIFRNYKQKQKANKLLESQNKIIVEKKHEIEQSIKYALGIQNAILPAVSEIIAFFKSSFLYYLPKDIVSGDFYWYSNINKNHVLFAVADCTGHGVPGALMSMVCSDKLNMVTAKHENAKPNEILKLVNNEIKQSLKQNIEINKQRDGMDIALISYLPQDNKLLYSGANRPLWILKNNKLIEYAPTKQSIGGYTELNALYNLQEIILEKNDLIILFTDGVVDQFGGEKGKKLMTKTLKNHFLENSSLPLHELENKTKKLFTQWKGSYEQVDDVLIFVFKHV
ncbi:MAG: SpoIIE family protein phosphatase [Bacteroidetes bacterium]|nr:SpoIIE family protein phosphatase [Bacteroidota bacterium]